MKREEEFDTKKSRTLLHSASLHSASLHSASLHSASLQQTSSTAVLDLPRLITLLVALAILAVSAWSFLPLNAQQGDCASGQPLEYTFAAGSTWDLCWSMSDVEGLGLHQLLFTPPGNTRRQVMKEATVAQIIVSPDSGSASTHYLPESGLGGANLIPLGSADCPDGDLIALEGRNVICQQVMQRGYIYRYFSQQKQGEYLSLFSIAQVDEEQIYIVAWRLYDDGTIEPMVGDAGTLAATGAEASTAGYITDIFWRLDIDIGANGDDDIVEQFDVLDTNDNTERELSVATISTETARTAAPDGKRSWRVRAGTLANGDGHLVSYQLEARNVGHAYQGVASEGATSEEWSQHQLSVTALNPCERLATRNAVVTLDPGAESCADEINQYVDGESLEGRDVLLWYRMSAHRLVSLEDFPAKNVEWQSFQLVPRDWTATTPFVE